MSALEGSVAMAHERPERPNSPYVPTEVHVVNKDTRMLHELVFNGFPLSEVELAWASKSPLQKLS